MLRPNLNPIFHTESQTTKPSQTWLSPSYRPECYQTGMTKSLNGKLYVRPKEPFVFGVPHKPTRQTEFTFVAFKVGLSNRARPMTISPGQPGEIVMTLEEWRGIEKEAEDMIVRRYLSFFAVRARSVVEGCGPLPQKYGTSERTIMIASGQPIAFPEHLHDYCSKDCVIVQATLEN
ncbi:hypothetical protein N7461_000951 [Penicillium sp. DV-2018c]|nr:hypothetical protein N7461_000951 [Penicillium sp. DV-2018c]